VPYVHVVFFRVLSHAVERYRKFSTFLGLPFIFCRLQSRRQPDKKDQKLSYRLGTARCIASVEILPIATQQCRNYLYDKSWPNRCYEVGGLDEGSVINMCTNMTRPSRFHCCIGVINKTTTNELWISPVYRRLAVAKFSKSTMLKLLTWPWPRPLREHSLITSLRLHMTNSHTKFEVSSGSRCGDITWGVKF